MSATPTRSTLDWRTLAPGDELTPLVLEITATRVVAGAIATPRLHAGPPRPPLRRAQGAPDIFMNILSDTAYCSRFLTDWAGPEAMVRRLAIRLGVPVFPGSTLTYTGQVTSVTEADGGGLVEVELRAACELGDHVTGTAVLHLA